MIELQAAAAGDALRGGALVVALALIRLAGEALGATLADRYDGAVGDRLIDQYMVVQILNGGEIPVANLGIGVEIPGDDELGALGQAAGLACVIHHVAGGLHVVLPEGDFGAVVLDVVARRVAEDRRGRVGDEEVDHLLLVAALDAHRHVRVVLGGERERLPGGVVIPGIAALAARRDRGLGVVAVVDDRVRFAGHILPLEVLEGADLLGIDGVLGHDGEGVLAVVVAKAPGVVRPTAHLAILVEVMAAHQAGVGGEVLQHRVADGLHLAVLGVGQVVVVERLQVGGIFAFAVVVELVEQEDIRSSALHYLGDIADLLHVQGFGLLCAAQAAVSEASQQGVLLGAGQGQFPAQHAWSGAIKGEVEGSEANHGIWSLGVIVAVTACHQSEGNGSGE